jgi:4-nitrophenyl phosphatase
MTDKKTIKALILDMDGVLWRDTEPIGDLPAIFKEIKSLGWAAAFVTNNATRSVDQYVQKLATFGVHAESSQIVNSGLATAKYLL